MNSLTSWKSMGFLLATIIASTVFFETCVCHYVSNALFILWQASPNPSYVLSWGDNLSYLGINYMDTAKELLAWVHSVKDEDESPLQRRKWMNVGGPAYEIANAPDFDTEWILKDPTVSHFDVYSNPIQSLYSQVHWTNHGPLPLPDDIVERYNNNNNSTNISSDETPININVDTMAIVGYEVDQVRIDPDTGKEVSVPITWAYNHHYMMWIQGSKAQSMVEVPVTPEMKQMGMSSHGEDTVWVPENSIYHNPKLGKNDFSSTFFSEGNGGEMRKSYHSYPKGYAQLIRNPTHFSMMPMQIDTWNRDTMKNTSRFVPPPTNHHRDYFPKSSTRRIVDHLTEANYNPLLECPCTDRISREWGMTYALKDLNDNDDLINNVDPDDAFGTLDNATECFEAASRLLPSPSVSQRTVPGDSSTGICTTVMRSDGSLEVVWDQSTKTLEGEDKRMKRDRWTKIIDGDVVSVKWEPRTKTLEERMEEEDARMKEWLKRRNIVANVDDEDDALVGSTPTGSIVNATIVVNTTSQRVEITLKGPYLNDNDLHDDRWFAMGLGASSMCIHMEADECTTGGPYAIVVLPPGIDSHRSRVIERKLDYHGAGRILSPSEEYSLKVISNKIEYDYQDSEKPRGRRRVVRLERALEGPTEDHYSFRVNDLQSKPLEMILATGCPHTQTFGRHCGHESPAPVPFARVNLIQKVERDGIKGSINGRPFDYGCAKEPYGELIPQHNPRCSVQTYAGGLRCCIHDHYLLDTNQTVPWQDQPLEYRLKFRFYYQDYHPSGAENKVATSKRKLGSSLDSTTSDIDDPSHSWLYRFYWDPDAEYDVPECETPSNSSTCVHTVTSRWKVSDFAPSNIKGIELIYAAPHCHAPTCLSMELYNADTGKLLCHVEPTSGRGRNSTTHTKEEEKYDEAGFIAIPPCLWSHTRSNKEQDQNLLTPDLLPPNTTLMSIKRCNSTYSHTGEMKSWQIRGLVVGHDDLTVSETSNIQNNEYEETIQMIQSAPVRLFVILAIVLGITSSIISIVAMMLLQ